MASFCRMCRSGEVVVKARDLTLADCNKFLLSGDDDSAPLLVLKAICIAGICTGMRREEFHNLRMSCITEIPTGYRITYQPCKQRGPVVSLFGDIPWRNPSDRSGPCFASIFQQYLTKLKTDLGVEIGSDNYVWYKGLPESTTASSHFKKCRMGYRTIGNFFVVFIYVFANCWFV